MNSDMVKGVCDKLAASLKSGCLEEDWVGMQACKAEQLRKTEELTCNETMRGCAEIRGKRLGDFGWRFELCRVALNVEYSQRNELMTQFWFFSLVLVRQVPSIMTEAIDPTTNSGHHKKHGCANIAGRQGQWWFNISTIR